MNLAFGGQRQGVKIKAYGFPESNDQNPLPVLRNKVRPIYYTVVNVVPKLFRQGLLDHTKGSSLVMRHKVLDVLKQESLGALLIDDTGDIKKQGALSFIVKPMSTAERVLL